MVFKNSIYFLFFIPVIFIVILGLSGRKKESSLKFSTGAFFEGMKTSFKLKLIKLRVVFRAVSLSLIILALARPQSPLSETEIIKEGIDIVLAIDVSTSMYAEDFTLKGKRRNRLYVVKDVVEEFIKGRLSDRISLVVFASRSYTVCPLTLDYSWLIANLERVQIGMVEDGTAIGSGISASLNRLKDTEAKGKVVILLTDGRNNAGKISPLTAAEAAKALDIKIYTIGAGTEGPVPFPYRTPYGGIAYKNVNIDIDEHTLIEVAKQTGGKYFRADSAEKLREVYKEIDKLEKIPIKERGFLEYNELFLAFLISGLVLLLLEILFYNTLLRKVP